MCVSFHDFCLTNLSSICGLNQLDEAATKIYQKNLKDNTIPFHIVNKNLTLLSLSSDIEKWMLLLWTDGYKYS